MLLLGKDYFEQDPPALPPEESCGLLGDGSEEDAVPCECPEKWYQKILPFLRRNRKGAVVAASVLVIGLGVYLNWYLYRTDVPAVKNEGETTEQSTAGEKDASSDYFSASVINRQRARDEAIAVLETIADGAAEQSPEKEDALAQISAIAQDIEKEAAVETLIKSKGFEECVAVISEGGASVVVKSSGLLENEIAQIQEIVYDTAGILPANLKIIEH